MNALFILFGGAICLALGYIFYSSYLERVWGVISGEKTPAEEINDGIDYVPAKPPVLMGHHFSSIAGAGPINGPIMAAPFGWVPVVLWIIFGGIFFGAVHDFGALYASIRHKGQSIGIVIQNTMGELMKKLFLVFGYFSLILVIAAFSSIVAKTFAAINPASEAFGQISGNPAQVLANTANAATAMISLLFIAIAVVFGLLFRKRGSSLLGLSIAGIIAIVAIVIVGLKFHPFYYSEKQWLIVIGIYITAASVMPVWILLQPRDYLSSFLLYAMMIIAIIGIIAAHPTVEMPAFTGWSNDKLGFIFPILFITVACGAISGFHSIVASGTTAKQLAEEKHARPIAYGSMLIECILAIMSTLAVAYVWQKYSAGGYAAPTAVFADGLSQMFAKIPGMADAQFTVYQLLILTISAFCLTTLDTSTRLARYMFQEFWLLEGQQVSETTGLMKLLTDKYVATVITIVLGMFLGLNGYQNIWSLFGAANQLLAGLGLLAIAVWLGKIGKKNFMLYIPLAFMMTATVTALILLILKDFNAIGTANSSVWNIARIFIAGLLLVLSIILLIKGVLTMMNQKSKALKA
ncbi:MAG: hypothetical protein J6M05_06235 [Cardiobacteriaceae bacterium]|nr:hypothetical protein [Cardiobacteriaceae bacterium]